MNIAQIVPPAEAKKQLHNKARRGSTLNLFATTQSATAGSNAAGADGSLSTTAPAQERSGGGDKYAFEIRTEVLLHSICKKF